MKIRVITTKTVFLLTVVALILALIPIVYYLCQPPLHQTFDWCICQDTPRGIKIVTVYPLGSADRAGIKEGDWLVSINRVKTETADQVARLLQSMKPGQYVSYEILREGRRHFYRVKLTDLHPMLYSYIFWRSYFWTFLIAGIIHVLSLQVLIPIVRRNKDERLTLILISLSACWIWASLICQLIVTFQGSEYNWLFHLFFGIAFFSVTFIPAIFVLKFFRDNLLATIKSRKFRALLSGVIFVPGAITYSLFLSHLIWGNPLHSVGEQYLIYISYLNYIPYTLLVLVAGFLCPTRGERKKINTFLIIYCVVFLAAALTLLTFARIRPQLPFPLIYFYLVMEISPTLLVLIYSYSTLKFGKIDYVIKKSLFYTIIAAIFIASYVFFIRRLSSNLNPISYFINPLLIESLLIFTLLLILRPVYRNVAGIFEKIIFREKYRSHQKIHDFVPKISRYQNENKLMQHALKVIISALNTRHGLIGYVGEHKAPAKPAKIIQNASLFKDVVARFKTNRKILNLRQNASIKFPIQLRNKGFEIIIPIYVGQKLEYLLALTGRQGNLIYSLEEVELLETLALQLGLGIEKIRLAERERELIVQAAEARLTALRSQINPHFLFNALNTISSLVLIDGNKAKLVTEKLANIFRRTLVSNQQIFIPLTEELQLIDDYLEIEKIRFGSKLQIEKNVTVVSPRIKIPALIIQPLVENAMKHGLSKKRGGGTLTIAITEHKQTLHIVIRDDGVGIDEIERADIFKRGMSLGNINERLTEIYGKKSRLKIESEPDKGTRVTIDIPTNKRNHSYENASHCC